MTKAEKFKLISEITEKNIFVFDFDGVIADSVEVKTNAFAKIYSQYGDDVVNSVIFHHRKHGGMNRFDKFNYYHDKFLGKTISPKELRVLSDRFSAIVVEDVIASKEIPGVKIFLEKFCTDKKCYINSATPEAEIYKIIGGRELKHYFEGVFGTPASKYTNLCKIHKLNPGMERNDFVFFGDSLSDLDAANQYGIYFIGVNSSKYNVLSGCVPYESLITDFNCLIRS